MPLVATPAEGLILLPFPCEARLRPYTTGQSSLEMKAEHKNFTSLCWWLLQRLLAQTDQQGLWSHSPPGSLSFWKCKQATGKPGFFRLYSTLVQIFWVQTPWQPQFRLPGTALNVFTG